MLTQSQLDPDVLAFARTIRATFGLGVKLRKGLPWPGGSDGGRKGR